MGLCCRLVLLVFTVLSAIVLYGVYDIIRPLPAPKIDVNEYWGPGSAKDYKSDSKPVQQTIAYNDKTIEDLRRKLNETVELHPALEGTGFQYGMNPKKLVEFIDYWKDDYLPRWREREQYFNTLPHYLINVQGLDIHYIHTKATYDVKGKKVIPILLIHGWPGSVREFFDIIPKLALPGDELNVVFEVVAPSLPGYGWSDGTTRTGMGFVKMSVVLRNLMIKLGYNRFYIQGGDWGAALGSSIATLFPENVIGFHSNMCILDTPLAQIKTFLSSLYPSLVVEDQVQDFFFPQWERIEKMIVESGYMHIQATKPDTIGAALTANPIGLAAYILEKFSTWTNPDYRSRDDGGFDNEDFSKDALLDNIMIYYLTGSITTSMRLYAESFAYKNRELEIDRTPTNVPIGCARFKHELFAVIDWALKDKFTNLIHSSYYQTGGHFAAMELPEILLNIHYIHQHPTGNVKGKTVVPLLLLHGWPGSVREFYEIIPKLAATNPELDVVFEIIAPSLVGFGWSDAARRPGFGCVSMATVMRNLMLKLGYTKFYVQGGDWGSIIGSHITTLYPENVVAYHSNMCAINSPLSMIKKTIAAYTKSFFVEKDIEDFMFPVSKKLEGILIEMGYFHIQATKPDTVGAVLTNNPIGLAAYILEKFSTWTNAEYRDREDGGFNSNDYSKDALLDNIMVYYLTNSIGTSVRLYAESFTKKELGYDMDRVPTTVPTGCARFRHDLGHHLDWELRDKYINLVHSKFHKRGGHFIAFEKPDVLYTDFIEFIKKLQK